jgi:hypothetical protein
VCPTNTYARTAIVIVQEPEIQTFDLPAAFLHPPPPRLYNMAKSDYAVVSGNADLAPQPDSGNGLLFRNSSVRFRDLTDGTVRRISNNIDLNTYQALATRAGSESVTEF